MAQGLGSSGNRGGSVEGRVPGPWRPGWDSCLPVYRSWLGQTCQGLSFLVFPDKSQEEA